MAQANSKSNAGQNNSYSDFTNSVLELCEGHSVEFLDSEFKQLIFLIKEKSKFSLSS